MEQIDNISRLYQNCIDYHRFIYKVKIQKHHLNKSNYYCFKMHMYPKGIEYELKCIESFTYTAKKIESKSICIENSKYQYCPTKNYTYLLLSHWKKWRMLSALTKTRRRDNGSRRERDVRKRENTVIGEDGEDNSNGGRQSVKA